MPARVFTAGALIPPRYSSTMGTNETPTALQASSWVDGFLASPARRAWPCVKAAPLMVGGCMVEMIVTSKAAGYPRSQLGRMMSAGRL